MSAPRIKRQFAGAASETSQRQITSFFSPRTPTTTPVAASSQPILPANVQTNLLNVGMRVRKSVPEGYKTGTYSSFKLWSDVDNTHVPVSSSAEPPTTSRSATLAASSQRELLPFCGIHKVGGLATQPSYDRHEERDNARHLPELDDIPGLTSSQESVESNASYAGSSSRKRIFHEAGEDTDGDTSARTWRECDAWLDGNVSPRSLAPVGPGNARVMAVPKGVARRKTAVTPGVTTSVPAVEQENMAIDDFEEADFLVVDGMDVSDS
ncbi:hypothetical protein SODALDRAFT_328771 [Sodiomyces alkalinus F11]|uniref:Uncharacterized protein n=1 Tax=Sodiomyces alkalinus (strain CBS 110278 / VKM F-3762 / F11) TaxID=1314773 RepID=A0A3N2PLZ4_SODAK|nr:hypothetical protein SODALDRAFT_328771 [Sodiomyces alkalinus F11]ROT35430.1 hypothetical protein SODALDRAFT_328771 [Sodiomyces alkalinus F11]